MTINNNSKITIIASAVDDGVISWLGEICEIIPYNPRIEKEIKTRPAALIIGPAAKNEHIRIITGIYPELPVIYIGNPEKTPDHINDIVSPPYNESSRTVLYQRLKLLDNLSTEIVSLRHKLRNKELFNSIIGESKSMMQFFLSLDRIIDLNVNVLITGESGTGKELIARAIHEGSSHRDGPFVAVNCAGIAPDIADSLLFGHVKGAFTGANTEHTGFFEQADNGTIFLDEIGELHPDVQAKLLRVIEDGKVRRVGGRAEKIINFRIISATNRDLAEESAMKKFRGDLFFRLEQFTLKVPPLRDRKGDIKILACHFLREICSFYELGDMTFSEEALKSLESREWPGNVRELRSYVQRLALQSMDSIIDDIEDIQQVSREKNTPEVYSDTEIIPLEVLERREIEKAYHHLNGEIERAALALGTSRATLYRKLKLYKLI